MTVATSFKKGFKQMLAEANAAIETISVHDALLEPVGHPDALFVDTREAHEIATAS